MTKVKIFLCCFMLMTLMAFTQQAKKDNKAKKTTAKETGLKEDAGTPKDELGISEGKEFVYQPRGRRDPFWDLLKGTDSAKIKRKGAEGIAGLEIDQLELEGIVFRKGRYIALFKGPDSKPYDVNVGQDVYDGEIIKIDANSVVFKKILTIALGGTKERTIVKRLNPEKEKDK
ncbi:MAG: pilus assembly protein PilP [bacterium]|nr:pilus assembly protein PilP [bacterium]